jgi:hypothetical protein
MPVYTDEIFGPVLSVLRVPTYERAVALVNADRTGTGRRSSPPTAERRAGSSGTPRPGGSG